ncbi:MAG: hypothetical protein M3340_20030, partial [Actinomycetota bacterium]|nr:hypothetical protein [Actinomycetota bacterium]
FKLNLGPAPIEILLGGEGVRRTESGGWTVDLRERGLGIPGLGLRKLVVQRARGGKPGAATLTGDIRAPFVSGQVTLTVDEEGNVSGGTKKAVFEVGILNRPLASFEYAERRWKGGLEIDGPQLKLPIPKVTVDEGRATAAFDGDRLTGSLTARFHHAALGAGNVSVTMTGDGFEGGGGFILDMPLLAGTKGAFTVADGKLGADVTLGMETAKSTIPGLTLTNVNGKITLVEGKLSGLVGLEAGYAGLGTLTLTEAAIGADGFRGAKGAVAVTAPPLTGSEVKFTLDAQGRPRGSIKIQSADIPIPALKKGQVVLTLREDGGIDASGSGRIEIGPVGGGDFKVSYAEGVLSVGADMVVNVPPLQPVEGRFDYKEGQLQGDLRTGVGLGPLSGTVLLSYRDQIFSGEGTLAYSLGRFAGKVLLRVDPEGKISGEGEATFRLTDWLTGTIGLVVHPDLNVDAAGTLALPGEIKLFKAWETEYSFFDFKDSFPLWGIKIPVVGTIGLIAKVFANAGFRANLGPGTFRNIKAEGNISTRPDVEPAFSISGDLNIPAGAEVVLEVGGGVGLAALVAELTGGIKVNGIAGVYGAITLSPTFAYEDGQYALRGTALLEAAAQLAAAVKAYAAVEVGVGWLSKRVWSRDWTLAEWRFDPGWNIGLKATISQVLGEPFAPQVALDKVAVDPMSIVQNAVPKSGKPVPAPPSTPTPTATFTPEAGDPGQVGAEPVAPEAVLPGAPTADGAAAPAPVPAPA